MGSENEGGMKPGMEVGYVVKDLCVALLHVSPIVVLPYW